MALDFSSYGTPVGLPDFSVFAIPADDGEVAGRPARMLRNAKVWRNSESPVALLSNRTTISPKAPATGESSPLFIAGNAKAILPLLEQHGIVLAVAIKGGVKVGRSQAGAARELLDAGVKN